MKIPMRRASPRGFTIVELLIVMGIIALLVSILVPSLSTARKRVKEGITRTEISALATAMHAYFSDWGEYPPDLTDDSPTPPAEQNLNSRQCLVYYLQGPNGTGFRTDDGFSRNGGPYFDFPPERLVGDPPVFADALGGQADRDVYSYSFDNNDADQGDQTNWHTNYEPDGNPPEDYEHYGWNVSNVHPMGVDIWSAGYDGDSDWVEELYVDKHPTQSNQNRHDPETYLDLGDDIGNW